MYLRLFDDKLTTLEIVMNEPSVYTMLKSYLSDENYHETNIYVPCLRKIKLHKLLSKNG
uniref:Uncharacterized protein n=1 Tax=Octopus bimaculoides TaxID=37653 RepID=A0A0L8HFH5_OCTBM